MATTSGRNRWLWQSTMKGFTSVWAVPVDAASPVARPAPFRKSRRAIPDLEEASGMGGSGFCSGNAVLDRPRRVLNFVRVTRPRSAASLLVFLLYIGTKGEAVDLEVFNL